MGILGLCSSRPSGLYGSGTSSIMKVGREVPGKWSPLGIAGYSRQLGLAQRAIEQGTAGLMKVGREVVGEWSLLGRADCSAAYL